MALIRIGTLDRARITIDVRGRAHPDFDDYWDGNWLSSTIRVDVAGWRGEFGADLHVSEFEEFLPEVRRLHSDLTGTADYLTMDGYLWMKLIGDGRGGIEVQGEVTDSPGYGNTLSFRFGLDQTFLPALTRDLEAALREFPALGERPTAQ